MEKGDCSIIISAWLQAVLDGEENRGTRQNWSQLNSGGTPLVHLHVWASVADTPVTVSNSAKEGQSWMEVYVIVC